MGENLKGEKLKELVEGCKKKNPKYQQKLYEMFASRFYGIAVRYIGDRDEAKDVLHDGFLKIFDKIHMYNYSGSFEGWLRQVFVNFVIDYLKKKKTVEYNDEISTRDSGELIDEGFNTIEESELSKLKIEVLLKLIDKLPPMYKMVFNLYAVEGYSHKEIAEYLGISEGTSKSNYSRAKQKLRQYINEYLKNRKV